MRRFALCFVLVALVGAGCSGEAADLRTVEEVRAAIAEAGIDCETVDPRGSSRLVSEAARCSDSDLQIYVFDSERHRDDWLKVGARLTPVATGPRWAVGGEAALVERVADELNGNYEAR